MAVDARTVLRRFCGRGGPDGRAAACRCWTWRRCRGGLGPGAAGVRAVGASIRSSGSASARCADCSGLAAQRQGCAARVPAMALACQPAGTCRLRSSLRFRDCGLSSDASERCCAGCAACRGSSGRLPGRSGCACCARSLSDVRGWPSVDEWIARRTAAGGLARRREPPARPRPTYGRCERCGRLAAIRVRCRVRPCRFTWRKAGKPDWDAWRREHPVARSPPASACWMLAGA